MPSNQPRARARWRGEYEGQQREDGSSVDEERWVTINQQDKKAAGVFD